MSKVAAILRFSVALLLSCGFSPSVYAQLPELDARTGATKLDEFATIRHCDLTARLDNLAIFVQETPGAKAHIIFYGPPGSEETPLKSLKDYLVDSRGIPGERIETTYGGRNSDLKLPKIQLWLVPRDALPPEPQQLAPPNLENFKGLFDDGRAWDRPEIEIEDEMMGPGIGSTSDASFVDILNQQNNAIGYLVVFSGEDAIPGAWRRIAQDQIDYLKKLNVDPARVKTIFGGHQKQTRRQLWILPKDAPPPVRDAGPELPPAKTVKVDDYYAETLGDPKNEARVFARLKEIVTAHKGVGVFVAVRLGSVEEPPVDDGEPEPADLKKLVEKWRVKLANTHKIFADRFVVSFTTAPEFESSHLRIWIVPKGQPLPDPNEEEVYEEDP
ncbi:MAG TPA: hypothetical protein VJM50_20095 [Pyrinomonadaceae bacterium]|nr:hypothetical protein [Pyrinomonadaceae bacterium]